MGDMQRTDRELGKPVAPGKPYHKHRGDRGHEEIFQQCLGVDAPHEDVWAGKVPDEVVQGSSEAVFSHIHQITARLIAVVKSQSSIKEKRQRNLVNDKTEPPLLI